MSSKIEQLNARKEGLYDPSNALRNSYNAPEKALDIIKNGTSLVPKKFSYINIVSLDAEGNPTRIDYYDDKETQETQLTMIGDVAGSLAGKSFVFYSGRDREKYYVWYTVNGAGIDPVIPDATGIVVPLEANDSAEIVAAATQAYIEIEANFYVRVFSGRNKITIYNKQGGITTNSADIDTNFEVETLNSGREVLVGSLDLTYDANQNVSSVKSYSGNWE